MSQKNLAHYGIPGQKWGVRNYQNYDGTLTEEGKKRYAKDKGIDNNSFVSRILNTFSNTVSTQIGQRLGKMFILFLFGPDNTK